MVLKRSREKETNYKEKRQTIRKRDKLIYDYNQKETNYKQKRQNRTPSKTPYRVLKRTLTHIFDGFKICLFCLFCLFFRFLIISIITQNNYNEFQI
jgi:lipopolysaccharide/colanic/teichoic acid biosynthesis glycosyltransferase